MPETDRRHGHNGGSAKGVDSASGAGKKVGGSEQSSGPCAIHKLPKDEEGNELYTLHGASKRCGCKQDVEDYVVTFDGWTDSEDVRLCPKHYVQLLRRKDLLLVETMVEVRDRFEREEAEGAAAEQPTASAPSRDSVVTSARSTASAGSFSWAGVAAANSIEEVDGKGYPARGMDRLGRPYGAAAQLVGEDKAEGAGEDRCGQFASLGCSAELCGDSLGMKVEGAHTVFWVVKCTGWSLDSTPEAPILEMYVVSCGRAVSVSGDSAGNRTGPWQLQWIDDSVVGDARNAMPKWDGCDAAGTPWSELTGGADWGEKISQLEMEAEYQQRGMPAVGVASGVGVGAGRGITGLPVPRSPQNAVQRWEQKVAEQSPPPVGSAE